MSALGAWRSAPYTEGGGLLYAGRTGTGMTESNLDNLWHRLQPLAVSKMPLDEPGRVGSEPG